MKTKRSKELMPGMTCTYREFDLLMLFLLVLGLSLSLAGFGGVAW